MTGSQKFGIFVYNAEALNEAPASTTLATLPREPESIQNFCKRAAAAGVTGTNTKIDENTLQFLNKVSEGGSKVYGGFGISNGEQAKALADSVEAIVAGSVFVRLITENQNDKDALFKAVRAKAEELTGTC